MQEKTITLAASTPEDAVLRVEAISADIERVRALLQDCCDDTQLIFAQIMADVTFELHEAHRRLLSMSRVAGGAA